MRNNAKPGEESPAQTFGVLCKREEDCKIPTVLRISVMKEPRRYPPYARDRHQWKKLYKARIAVERVNSHLDSALGLSDKKVRSLKKQELFVAGGLLVMIGNAFVKARASKKSGEEVNAKDLRKLRRAG